MKKTIFTFIDYTEKREDKRYDKIFHVPSKYKENIFESKKKEKIAISDKWKKSMIKVS